MRHETVRPHSDALIDRNPRARFAAVSPDGGRFDRRACSGWPARRAEILWAAAVLCTMTVAVSSTAPTAVDDSYEAESGRTLHVDPPGLLANDLVPNGESRTPVLVSPPASGAELRLLSGGAFEYVPPPSFVRDDAFTYVLESTRAVRPATVTLSVVKAGAEQLYVDEGAYLDALAREGYSLLAEGFEDEEVWGHVRSTIPGGSRTAASVSSRGVLWTANNLDSEVTTGGGAARTGEWGFYSLPHGDYAAGIDCDVEGNCGDGWSGTGDERLHAVGGWIETNTPFARLVFVLDGDRAHPVDFEDIPVTTAPAFFGVIVPAGFTSFEVREMEGTSEDQKFLFSDDFRIGVLPELTLTIAGTCPGPVDVALTGAAPGASLVLAWAPDIGVLSFSNEECGRTDLLLDGPRVVARWEADEQGGAQLGIRAPEAACGGVLQAVDVTACTPSRVVRLP